MTVSHSNPRSADEIEDWFRQHVATLVGLTVAHVPGTADFESFGIDSIQGVDMVTALESWLGLSEDLPLEYVFEASSIAEAAGRVSDALRDGTIAS
ncbi:hypothetical protein BH10PSE13_BH10PSE13_02620 [soil metagenome]